MFRGLINDAKSAASSLVLKYVARASVAIPFVIALGFALAALTVWLVNQYGYVTGYLLMAGGLAAVGVIAALVVSFKEHEEEVAEEAAEEADTSKCGDRSCSTGSPGAAWCTVHHAWGRLLGPESGAGPGPQLPARPAAGPSRRFILAVGGGRGHRDDTPSPQRL